MQIFLLSIVSVKNLIFILNLQKRFPRWKSPLLFTVWPAILHQIFFTGNGEMSKLMSFSKFEILSIHRSPATWTMFFFTNILSLKLQSLKYKWIRPKLTLSLFPLPYLPTEICPIQVIWLPFFDNIFSLIFRATFFTFLIINIYT